MDTHETPDAFDRMVGANIRDLRMAREMTQAALARALEDRGFSFKQQHVVKVEKGQRALRLREADAIAAILDVDVDVLLEADTPTFAKTHLLVTSISRVQTHWEGLRREAADLYAAKGDLARHLDPYRNDREAAERVPRHILDTAETLLQVDPVEVVTTEPAIADAKMQVRNAEYHAAVHSTSFRGNWEESAETASRDDYELAAHDEEHTIEDEQGHDEHP